MTGVFVTGMGIVSALGVDIKSNLQELRKGLTGIKKAIHFKSKHSGYRPFGEVDISDKLLSNLLSGKQKGTLARTDLFAIKAVEEAIAQAGLGNKEVSDYSTALISASTLGGMCHTDELYHDATNKDIPPTGYLDTYTCDAHTMVLGERFNIKGIPATINTACSSSANAIMMGVRLIRSGRANRAIVGGTDGLAKFTVNGFNAMGILSEKACRPFAELRDGLTLGEGAAYLVLESEDYLDNKNVYAKVRGFGNANDAFHPSAISDEGIGPTTAMIEALRSANIPPSKIDYINAHGTGTENNDRTELKAIENVFGQIPPIISTKAYTGHTLGAAGAIEAVFSIFSIIHGEHYPTLIKGKPIKPFAVLPGKEYKKNLKINNVLSNSFGFAGNCTSLIFSKP